MPTLSFSNQLFQLVNENGNGKYSMQFSNFLYKTLIPIFLLISSASILNAQNDTIVMTTGEYLVGEIKGFDEGVVQIETDYKPIRAKAGTCYSDCMVRSRLGSIKPGDLAKWN